MQRVTLPRTDLSVSPLAFGCWGIASDFHWGDRDDSESIAAIHAALDAGINFFDTAEVYGNGSSETLLNSAIGSRRDEIVLASKPSPKDMSRDGIIAACEASLQRLGTDHLDLYQTHWVDRAVPLEETWEAMRTLREQGKVRHIGVCNMGVGDLTEISGIEPPVSDQLPYNLIWRAIEAEILPKCREEQIGVLAYSPLQHGMLADKYRSAVEVPDGRARSRHFSTERELARHGEPGCESETFAAIDAIRTIAVEQNRTMADLSLAWVLARDGITSVIVGVRNAEQLGQNLATFDNPLDAETTAALDAATADLMTTLGPNPDMWDGGEKSRYR